MTAAPAATTTLSAADREAALARVRRFAHVMDSLIDLPGTDFRVGLDALVGLVPVWGDVATALVSCYVPYEAYRLGAPTGVLLRMALNILGDALIGLVPVLGDFLDAVWKANERNVELLEDYLSG